MLGEIVFITTFVGLMISWPFILKGKARWFWFACMSGCMIWFGIMEGVAKWFGGENHTLSQYFWLYFKDHTLGGSLAIGAMLLAWLLLMLHLSWKKIVPIVQQNWLLKKILSLFQKKEN